METHQEEPGASGDAGADEVHDEEDHEDGGEDVKALGADRSLNSR